MKAQRSAETKAELKVYSMDVPLADPRDGWMVDWMVAMRDERLAEQMAALLVYRMVETKGAMRVPSLDDCSDVISAAKMASKTVYRSDAMMDGYSAL